MTRRGALRYRHTATAVIGCLTLSLFLTLALASPAAASKLSREKARAKAISQEIGALDERLAALAESYAVASAELKAVNERIATNQERLAAAEIELQAARDAAGLRAAALYKERPVTLVDVIAGSSSFSELLTQIQFLVKMSQHDECLLTDLRQMKGEVAQRRRELMADREAARTALERKKAEQARVREALAERKSTLAGLRDEIDRLEAALRRPIVRSTPTPVAAGADSGGSGSGASTTVPSGGWWPLIQEAASANGIDPNGMYRLMMMESGGQPAIVGSGLYHGLFQYSESTWRASWNPWASADIHDGAAQIQATALALKMGKGPYWWPNTYGPSFSGT